jgi:23S rRNA pseudouridine1911/1915/1917 synthase
LLVVAKTLEAHKSLVDQLQERTVSRVYIAVAWGKLISKMEIIKSLGRNKYNRKKFSVSENSYAKESQTNINPVGYGTVFNRPVSIIECQLKTGRTHQIRVHLEYVNHPIIGDKTYKKGAPTITGLKIERQALHAKSLSFVHPCSNENVKFYSNIPTDILDLMTLAGAI